MKDARIPTLDGMRAVAIIIVIADHAHHVGKIALLGPMGVLLFFALSGYLITTRLLAEHAKTGSISLKNFYLRRAFRILPPAIVYLIVLSALVATGVVICSPRIIWAALLFCVNYLDPGELGWRAGHFWSLSVEEHFYLLWPLALITWGVTRGWRTALYVVGAVIAWRVIDHHYHILEAVFHNPNLHWNFAGTDANADALLWGCALAFFKFELKPLISMALAIGSAVLLALMVMNVRLPFPPHNADFLITMQHFLPAVILAAILSCPGSILGRFLELPAMRFIGHLSYSLYIWQQLFLGGPGNTLPMALGLIAAFACAYLSYRYVEQPSIEFGKTVILRYRSLPIPVQPSEVT